MRFARAIFLMMVATTVSTTALAQIRIVPLEMRDSVANPTTIERSDMHFVQGQNIDFGTFAEDGGLQRRVVKWSNCGTEAIIITRITTSCGCVRCDYERKAIEGNKSSEIAITYHPKGHPGTMRHRIFVYTNRSEQLPSAILDIKGNVVASADRSGDYGFAIGELLLRQRHIRLEATAEGLQRVSIACMNGGKTPLTPRVDTLLSSKCLSLRSVPQTLKPGEEGDLIISYNSAENQTQKALRLFVENGKLAPRDREIKIITEY